MDVIEANDLRRKLNTRQEILTNTCNVLAELLTDSQLLKLRLLLKNFDICERGFFIASTIDIARVINVKTFHVKSTLAGLFARCGGKFEMEEVYLDINGKERQVDVSELFGNKGGRGRACHLKIRCTPIERVLKRQRKVV